MAITGDRSGGVVQNCRSYNPTGLPSECVKPSVLTERNCLRWMVLYVPPLFTLPQIMSLKQGRGCARYLILKVCIKWQETWFFPLVRMQLPWEGVCFICSRRVQVSALRSTANGMGVSQPPPNKPSSTLLVTS